MDNIDTIADARHDHCSTAVGNTISQVTGCKAPPKEGAKEVRHRSENPRVILAKGPPRQAPVI